MGLFYPMGKPAAASEFHKLAGAWGQNKTCKERQQPGSQGWLRGSCAHAGYTKRVLGTLGAPEYVKAGQSPVNYFV